MRVPGGTDQYPSLTRVVSRNWSYSVPTDGILAGSPTSVRLSLQTMAETEGVADTHEAVSLPSSALDELMVSEDMIEGLRAFAQTRPPVWRNR